MISAVDKLLYIQRNFSCLQETPKRRFRNITIYSVSGLITFCVIWFFWEFFINPCLLNIGITPLTMVRIIATAHRHFLSWFGACGFFTALVESPLVFSAHYCRNCMYRPKNSHRLYRIFLYSLYCRRIGSSKEATENYFFKISHFADFFCFIPSNKA